MALKKIDLMHKFFGICEGHTCGECSNLVEEPYHGRMYRKCKVRLERICRKLGIEVPQLQEPEAKEESES